MKRALQVLHQFAWQFGYEIGLLFGYLIRLLNYIMFPFNKPF